MGIEIGRCAIATPSNFPSFSYVQEWQDDFLACFPHRFDYIYAQHPLPAERPNWQTEQRYPLSDRLIRQGSYLYGVRFGTETKYCLLDIDRSSPYHPSRDPLAIARILAVLEPLGLVSYVACTSSYSGGIHLYFPFQQAQKTWELALVLQTVLNGAGFKPAPGQLELFPNPRNSVTAGHPPLYAAHRLPMQVGSYLLNQDWTVVYSHQSLFVRQWNFAQARNDVDAQTIKQVLKTAQRKQYSLSGRANQFLNDLNADIEPGWTGFGQTNFILGRIAMRSYVFGHLLYATFPLEGNALIQDIVRVAQSLPGYQQWCRHQHEIEKRASEWARSVENSHYFHFGRSKMAPSHREGLPGTNAIESPTWNQRQSQAARTRIQQAIADLLEQGALPATPTARFHALLHYGIGGGSLYRHRDLWHPNHLTQQPVESPPDPPTLSGEHAEDLRETQSSACYSLSLLEANGSNPGRDAGSMDCNPGQSVDGGRNPGMREEAETGHDGASSSPVGSEYVRKVLIELRTWADTRQEAALEAQARTYQNRGEAHWKAYTAQMERFLASGDPILVAEAIAWMQLNGLTGWEPCRTDMNQ